MGDLQNDLEFLDTYWIRAKEIAERIKKELKVVECKPINKIGNLVIVEYKDLTNWNVSINGDSEALAEIADKVSYMILNNQSDSIKRMLVGICKKGVFKSRRGPYTLNEIEIKRIRNYFKI